MKTQRTFSVLLTAVAVIAMAGLGVVGTASAAVPSPVQIAIKAQDCCDTGLWVALPVDESGTGIFDVNGVAPAPNTPIVGLATEAVGR